MVVNDKQAEIAILRTIGATPSTILWVFIVQGMMVGIVGTVLGLAGWFSTWRKMQRQLSIIYNPSFMSKSYLQVFISLIIYPLKFYSVTYGIVCVYGITHEFCSLLFILPGAPQKR